MKHSLLLIQPKVGKLDYAGLRLPEALLAIAAYPVQQGYDVRIIDQRIDENWKDHVKEYLDSHQVLCVGITCMTGPQIKHAIEISQYVKSLKNDLPVVWGGVHSSLFPEQCLEKDYVDHVVRGEGEDTFLELLERLRKKEGLEGLAGLVFKKGGRIIKNDPRPFISGLDRIPFLPYDLVDVAKYRASGIFKGPSLTFFSSRGCPFPCAFCYNKSYNKGQWRSFSPKGTVDRLEHIVKKYGIKKFFIQDDNFIVNIEHFKKLMQELIERNLNIEWACLGIRIDTLEKIGREGLELLVKAGCRDIDIGIESGSSRILKMIKKDISRERVLAVNRMLFEFSLHSKCTFIIGFPGETEEEVQQTVDLALQMSRENPKVFTLIFVYCPYPGTELFQKAVAAGFQTPRHLEEWGNFTRDAWFFDVKNWLTEKQKKRYNSICFTSMFASKAGKTKISSPLLRVLFDLYHPIAKFRLKHDFHRFQVEAKIFNHTK